jgi:hypothetical protein
MCFYDLVSGLSSLLQLHYLYRPSHSLFLANMHSVEIAQIIEAQQRRYKGETHEQLGAWAIVVDAVAVVVLSTPSLLPAIPQPKNDTVHDDSDCRSLNH